MNATRLRQVDNRLRASPLEMVVLRLAVIALTPLTAAMLIVNVGGETKSIWSLIQIAVMTVAVGLMLIWEKHSVPALALIATILIGWQGRHMEVSARWPTVALVCLPLIALAFTRRRRVITLVGGALIAAGFAVTWEDPYRWGTAGVLLLAVLGLGFIMIRTHEEQKRAARRSAALFGLSPTAMVDLDYGKVLDEFEILRKSGVTDLAQYLHDHPSTITEWHILVRRVTANQAMANLFELESPSEYLSVGIGGSINVTGMRACPDLFVNLWNGVYECSQITPAVTTKGKPLWLQVTSFAHPERPGRMIVTLVDITELEEHRVRLRELLDSKNRFVASISHELRTPLSAVVGFLTTLNDQWRHLDPCEVDEFLAHATRQANEVSNITEDLLVAARADVSEIAVELAPMDPVVEAQVVVEIIGGFEFKPRRDVPAVCADANRYRQIIRNLASNALRYGGDNRRISFVDDGGQVAIEVRDDGPALDSETLERIFLPYQRADGAINAVSIGLGLTVSKILAELMHGTLCAFRDGPETVFCLKLPSTGTCIHSSGSNPHT